METQALYEDFIREATQSGQRWKSTQTEFGKKLKKLIPMGDAPHSRGVFISQKRTYFNYSAQRALSNEASIQNADNVRHL